MEKNAQYEVKKVGSRYRVWSTKSKGWITKDCPKEIAEEICEDFNKMDNKDYTPIGGPNVSKSYNK